MPVTRKRKATKTFSEQYDSILKSQTHPVIANELLKKVKEDGIASLNREESHVFWRSLHDNSVAHLQILFPDEVEACTQDRETSVEFLDVVFFLLHQLLETREPNVENFSSQIFIVLVGLLKNDCLEEKVKQKIVKLSEEWCRRKLLLYNSAIVVTFEYLFEVSLKKGATKADVRRACGLRSAVKLESNIAKNRQLFLDAMKNINYLTTKEGCRFLALVLTMDEELTKDMHGVCKGFLLECNRNIAKAYGDIYYTAWSVAETGMRKFIEEYLIQDFMARIMDLKRQVLEMSPLGQKVLTILHAFHIHKSNTQVRSMLAALYEPILWRNLKSPNSTVRSNAAEVFLDAYPLERCGEGRDKNVAFAEKQHKIMTELLTDKWHVVRIFAVRHICQIASDFWQVIPPEVIQQWLTIVITQLAWDSSSAEVRRSVYRGMRALVVNPLCAEYMQKVLPHMQDGIHDTNARVRTAFVEMLVACKDASSIKFWLIVPLNHLLARLEVDEQAVAQRIVKLLFESFYPYERGPEVTLKRIMNMIVLSPVGSRKFFFYSKSVLSFESSVQLVLSIMTYILRYVKSELSGKLTASNATKQDKAAKTSKDNKEAPASKRRRISSSDPVSSLETSGPLNIEAADGETNLYFKTSLENPLVSEIFIDIVSTLLTIHEHKKQEAEHKEQWQKMYAMCKMCIPDFLRYFKGTRTYDSVLYLCSLMPQSVRKSIRPVFHLDSTCLSQLKALSVDSSDEEVLKLVSLLCSWNRGDELLEMAKNWIDEALRAEDLNSTRYGEPRAERRKVKIKDAREPNPLLGFRVLNAIFCYPPNNAKILSKHYNLIVEIWNYLERVKKLIETRMEHSSAFDSCLLSDEFIVECFSRYLKMIPYLKIGSEGHKFDSESAYTTILDWSEKILISSLPKEFPLTNDDTTVEWVVIDSVGPLLVSLLNEVIKVGANMILLGQASVKLTSKVIRLCKLLLRTGCRVMFVYSACGVMHHISDYYKKILSGKNLAVLFSTVANLLGDCVASLTDLAFTKDGLKLHIENFAETRTAMINTLMLLSKTFGASNELFLKTFNKFLTAVTVIMKKDGGLLENITALKKVQDLPYVASQFVTSFFNNKILTEMMFQTLQKNISGIYQEDSSQLLAALGLLLLFVRYRRYVSVESLKSALNSAESAVVSYHAQISKDESMEIDETILEKMVEILKEARTELTNPQKDTEQDLEEEQDDQPDNVKQKKFTKPDSPVNNNSNQNAEDACETSTTGRKRRTRKSRVFKNNVQVVKENQRVLKNKRKKLEPSEKEDSVTQNKSETPDSSFHKTSEDETETNSSGRKSGTRKRRVSEKKVEVIKAARTEIANARKETEYNVEPENIQMEEEQEIEQTDNEKQKECEMSDTPVNKTHEDPNEISNSGRKSRNSKRRVFEKAVEALKEAHNDTRKAQKEDEEDAEPTNTQMEVEEEVEPPDSEKQKECETPDPPASKMPEDANETSSSGRKSRTSKRRVFEKTEEVCKVARTDKRNAQKDFEKNVEQINKQMEEEQEVNPPESVKQKECETPDLSVSKTHEDADENSSNRRKSRSATRRVFEKKVEVVREAHTEKRKARKEVEMDAKPTNKEVEEEQEAESLDSGKQNKSVTPDSSASKTPEESNETSNNRRKSRTSKRRIFEDTEEVQKEASNDKINVKKKVGKDAEPINKQMEGEQEVEPAGSAKQKEYETPDPLASKTPEDTNETSSSGRKLRTAKRRFIEKTVEVVKAGHTEIKNARKEIAQDAEPGNMQMQEEQEIEPTEKSDPPVNKKNNESPVDTNGTSRNRRKSRTCKEQ